MTESQRDWLFLTGEWRLLHLIASFAAIMLNLSTTSSSLVIRWIFSGGKFGVGGILHVPVHHLWLILNLAGAFQLLPGFLLRFLKLYVSCACGLYGFGKIVLLMRKGRKWIG